MKTTIEDLARLAEQAEERWRHYVNETNRLYNDLMNSGGRLKPEEVAKYVEEIETTRSSGKAAQDLLGDVLRELHAVASAAAKQKDIA